MINQLLIIIICILILIIIKEINNINNINNTNETFNIVNGYIPSTDIIKSFVTANPSTCIQSCIAEDKCNSLDYNYINKTCNLKAIKSPPIVPDHNSLAFTYDDDYILKTMRILP